MRRKIQNPFRYKIENEPLQTHTPKQYSLEKILETFATNKITPKHMEEVFYSTIEKYPELRDTYILIIESKFFGVQHTLRAIPPLLSILNKKKERVYAIMINTNKKTPVPFHSLPIEKQKGIIAHELAHILDYTQRTSLEIIGLGFNLLFSKKFVRKFEQYTDRIAIQKGFGYHLLALRKHILDTEIFSYQRYHQKIYLSPEQIEQEIQKYIEVYKNFESDTRLKITTQYR